MAMDRSLDWCSAYHIGRGRGATRWNTRSLPGWLKSVILIEPFASIIVTFGGMWLLTDGPLWWSYVIGASGVFMVLCFAVNKLIVAVVVVTKRQYL